MNDIYKSALDRADEDLLVPNSSSNYFEYYTIKKGDTIYAIAKKYNINPDLLVALNGLEESDYIYPDQVMLIPKSNYSYYITKNGDTLEGVANVFGISVQDLMKQNGVIYLLDGQMLVKRAE